MFSLGRAIQAAIVFSTLLGVVFLWQVNGLLPYMVFEFVATGWAFFVLDSALTFVKPRASYVLGFVLAVLALATSLPQAAHYAFIQAGELLPSATFILGSGAQFLIIALVPYFFLRERRRPAAGLVQGE